jgi:hypothetical protein
MLYELSDDEIFAGALSLTSSSIYRRQACLRTPRLQLTPTSTQTAPHFLRNG